MTVVGKLRVEGLEALCRIGVDEGERAERRRILISLELEVELDEALRTDSLERAVDYAELSREVLDYAESSSFRLIESLAYGVAKLCLSKPRVLAARVKVRKPGVPRPAAAAEAEVELRREGPRP